MERVLEGVKVIELSQYAAAPAAGRLLAEMGADVVKVEPLSGDSMRYVGPSFGLPGRQDENVAFQMVNAGKKSIALDLKSPEGQEIMDKLLAGADIFFTNVRMKALQSLGLSWEALHERHPRLIFGHVSGYGLKGDDAGLPGYDATAFWARGGALIDLPYEGSAPPHHHLPVPGRQGPDALHPHLREGVARGVPPPPAGGLGGRCALRHPARNHGA